MSTVAVEQQQSWRPYAQANFKPLIPSHATAALAARQSQHSALPRVGGARTLHSLSSNARASTNSMRSSIVNASTAAAASNCSDSTDSETGNSNRESVSVSAYLDRAKLLSHSNETTADALPSLSRIDLGHRQRRNSSTSNSRRSGHGAHSSHGSRRPSRASSTSSQSSSYSSADDRDIDSYYMMVPPTPSPHMLPSPPP